MFFVVIARFISVGLDLHIVPLEVVGENEEGASVVGTHWTESAVLTDREPLQARAAK